MCFMSYTLYCIINKKIFNRKQIKRISTSELTLGGVTAPPPSGTSSLPNAMEVLQCFTDTGSPNQELSPVAMVNKWIYILIIQCIHV